MAVSLYHEVHGDGPPLVLIAGLGTDSTSWVFQVPVLAASHRVIVLDNRGMPRSSVPPGPYSVEAMADDTAGLLEGLGVDRAVVVGHSMGGCIAQQLALRHPARVAGLVLASTSARFDGLSLELCRTWAAQLEAGLDRETFVRGLLPWLLARRFFDDPAMVAEAVRLFVETPWPQSPEGFRAQVDALEGHDTQGRLAEIQVPTLVLVGSEDRISPPADGRALADGIPGARFSVLEGCSHSCMLDDPGNFNRLVLELAASA